MMRHLFVVWIWVLCNLTLYAQPVVPPGYTAQLIFEGLNPVSMASSADGTIFVTEKNGRILIVKNDVLLSAPLANVEVDNVGEHGLIGIALDPEFDHNQFLYLYYTVAGKNHNRVSRFHFVESELTLEDEDILLDLDPLLGLNHSGGCLKFGADGKLYIGTGDGSKGQNSQDLSSLLGKILRINPDGSIPTDNPFFLSNEGKYRAIYAYGFRNPFTFSFNAHGRLFANDVGAESFEEINEVFAGKNYGWPLVEGPLTDDVSEPENYIDPVFSYSHDDGCAITGSSFFPSITNGDYAAFSNQYLFGEYCKGVIMLLNPETGETSEFIKGTRFPIAIETTPEGELLFLTFKDGGGQLWKITKSSDGAPKIAIAPKDALAVIGESVEFLAKVVGERPFTYQWKLEDSAIEDERDSVLILTDVQLDQNGSHYTCEITNAKGSVETAPVALTVTDRPRPQITFDLSYTTLPYNAGDTIVVKALVMDEIQGKIPNSALAWKVDFHHDFHTHPVSTDKGIDSIAFIIPRIGETAPNVWHRISLEATNDVNLSTHEYVDLFPAKSQFLVQTVPDSLTVFLDGKPAKAPYEITSVVGLTRNLSVQKSQLKKDSIYLFRGWTKTNATETSLLFNVSSHDAVYRAIYQSEFLGDGTGLKGEFYTSDKVFEGKSTYTRISEVNFDWGIHSPDESISSDNFSSVWNGYIRIPLTGLYTFHLLVDDGAELVIDQEVLISDLLYGHPPTEFVAKKELIGGKIYPITLKYYEATGGATIRLYWSSDLINKSIIPANALYPAYPAPEVAFLKSPEASFSLGQEIQSEAKALDKGKRDIGPEGFSWEISLVDESKNIKQVLRRESDTKRISFIIPDTISYSISTSIETRLIVTDKNGFTDTLVTISKPKMSNLTINGPNTVSKIKLNQTLATLPFSTALISGSKIKLEIAEKDKLKIEDDTLFYAAKTWLLDLPEFKITNDTVITFTYSKTALNNGNGLNVAYFSAGNSFTASPDSTGLVENVDFTLVYDRQPQYLKIHWSGHISPPIEGYYSIELLTEGKWKIMINEELHSADNAITNKTFLETAYYYSIDVFYESVTATDNVKLVWQPEGLPRFTIPQNQLFSDMDFASHFLQVFPNPVNHTLYVNLEKLSHSGSIILTLLDFQGNQIFTRELNSRACEISTETLPRGMYILMVQTNTGRYITKVVK